MLAATVELGERRQQQRAAETAAAPGLPRAQGADPAAAEPDGVDLGGDRPRRPRGRGRRATGPTRARPKVCCRQSSRSCGSWPQWSAKASSRTRVHGLLVARAERRHLESGRPLRRPAAGRRGRSASGRSGGSARVAAARANRPAAAESAATTLVRAIVAAAGARPPPPASRAAPRRARGPVRRVDVPVEIERASSPAVERPYRPAAVSASKEKRVSRSRSRRAHQLATSAASIVSGILEVRPVEGVHQLRAAAASSASPGGP